MEMEKAEFMMIPRPTTTASREAAGCCAEVGYALRGWSAAGARS